MLFMIYSLTGMSQENNYSVTPNVKNYIMDVSSLVAGNYILVLHNSLDQKRSFYIIKQ